MQKLLTKTQFAKAAGVYPSTVTRLCKTSLKAAVLGKHIDAAHPDAVEYLEKRDRAQQPPAATGLDSLYEDAVRECQTSGRYTTNYIRIALNIGATRAAQILKVMALNGVVPGTEAVEIPEAKLKGQASVKNKKKQAINILIAAKIRCFVFPELTPQ